MLKERIKIPPYEDLPLKKVKIEQLETLLEKRMQILDKLDAKIQIKEGRTVYLEENFLEKILKQEEDSLDWKTNPEDDVISLYFLCLAFCKTDSFKTW